MIENDISKRLEAIEKKLDVLQQKPVSHRVQAEFKKTDSDIQIVGGATTVTKEGVLVGLTMMPVPNQPGVMAQVGVVKFDNEDNLAVVGLDGLKFV